MVLGKIGNKVSYLFKHLLFKALKGIGNIQKKKHTKPIVLFMDRPECAGDNAEVLCYYFQHQEECDSYFILQKDSHDWKRLSLNANVVDANSFRYLLLYLQADIIVTSHELIQPKMYFCLYDYKDYKLVWLQHGIMHGDLSKIYNASCGHDLVTVVTKDEYKDRLNPKYGYNENQIALTGFARYDSLYNDTKKLITISLTWRKYLDDSSVNDFVQTSYYSMFEDLIVSPEFADIAEKHGYQIQVLFHARLSDSIKKFILDKMDKRIKHIHDILFQDILAESALLITDYSSLSFDIAYLKKPTVYYQEDADEFFSGKHTYTRGYFDYKKDGFGEVVYNKETLLKTVNEYMQNDCKMKDIYADRADKTFEYFDRKNCERIYNEIKTRFLND